DVDAVVGDHAMEQAKAPKQRNRDEPEPSEVERAIEVMAGGSKRLAIFWPEKHPEPCAGFFIGDVDTGNRRTVADRQPCRRATRGRHRERREVLRAETSPERIRDLARLGELVGRLLDDLLIGKRDGKLVSGLAAAARSFVRDRSEDHSHPLTRPTPDDVDSEEIGVSRETKALLDRTSVARRRPK